MEIINLFRGEYGFLSNMYSCKVIYNSIEYPSAEHAYVATKTNDIEIKKLIASLSSPVAAKVYGKSIPLDPAHGDHRYSYMTGVVTCKFLQNDFLLQKLLSTSPSPIIEGNTWGDTYWGVCNGKGKNYLGIILMKIRSDFL